MIVFVNSERVEVTTSGSSLLNPNWNALRVRSFSCCVREEEEDGGEEVEEDIGSRLLKRYTSIPYTHYGALPINALQ